MSIPGVDVSLWRLSDLGAIRFEVRLASNIRHQADRFLNS